MSKDLSYWIQVHQSLTNHKKRIRLTAQLHTEKFATVGLLVYLWCWALNNAPDGKLDGVTPEELWEGIGWGKTLKGMVSAIAALVAAGWISGGEYTGGLLDGRELHDWELYSGGLIQKKRAEYMREYRQKHKSTTPNTPVSTNPAGQIFREYERAFGVMATQSVSEELIELEKEYPRELICKALREAAGKGKRSLVYTRGILDNWRSIPQTPTPAPKFEDAGTPDWWKQRQERLAERGVKE